jgi:hypothetical protein
LYRSFVVKDSSKSDKRRKSDAAQGNPNPNTDILKPTGATEPRYREPLKLLLVHGRGNANSGA